MSSLPAAALRERASAWLEGRVSVLHKLAVLMLALATPLALASAVFWRNTELQTAQLRRESTALAYIERIWPITAAATRFDGAAVAAHAKDTLDPADASRFAVQAEAERFAQARRQADLAAITMNGLRLIGAVSDSAPIGADAEPSARDAAWLVSIRLPRLMALTVMVCDASIRGDRVSLMRAVGALEEVSARSADGGYSAARIATGVSKATVEAHARALAVTARDFAAAAEGQGAAAPLDAVSLAQLLDAERRTALAIDHLWRDSARIRRISIESRIARISERRRTMFAVWMSLLGLNALLAIALAQSIVRPQRALADAMNRLSHGDTASEPPFQSYRNEIGEMARAVGVFRQTLVERDALERDLQAERKVLERRVAERTQALEAANSAKTNFVASLSHEIRTPLNGVLGMAAALERTPLNAQQRDMVKILTASGDVLLRLLNNAIDISRIESGKAELDVAPFDLKELMDFAVSLYRAQAEAKGLWLDLAIAPDAAGAYRGDAVRIRQVVQNFVSNAVKFTERGGVSVSVAKIARQDGRFALRFEVNDTGIGLPAKPERLFQTFTQGDRTVARRFGGAGLGLAICKEIAALMGGELSARPRAGGGSTFRFDAPLERIARMADELPPPVQTLRGLRTLVVDDNPMNRLVLQALLRQFGVEPEMAHGGREALEAADAGPYDLILLDVRMPDLDGLAVARAIRARPGPNRTTPIIALSGESAREEIERHIAAGMNGHVSKPIQVEALLAAIGAAVAAEGERRRAQSRLV